LRNGLGGSLSGARRKYKFPSSPFSVLKLGGTAYGEKTALSLSAVEKMPFGESVAVPADTEMLRLANMYSSIGPFSWTRFANLDESLE
jgi:hypothetical protein